MSEIWKPVVGYPKYEVSNLGNVKSYWHKKPRILKPILAGENYLAVELYADSKQKHYVHRLVAQAFIPNPDNKREVNHINGNKADNRVENLEWCTRLENQQHASATGLFKTGEDARLALLTNEQVEWCRSVYKPYDKEFGQAALARKLGVGKLAIMHAVQGTTYRNANGVAHKKVRHVVPSEVREEIRRLYVRGSKEFGAPALAKRFGIGKTTAMSIVNEATR